MPLPPRLRLLAPRLCLGAPAVIQRRSIWFPARVWEPGTLPLPSLLAPRLCLGALAVIQHQRRSIWFP
ncbi:hypothetical protein, partial [Leptolyngbya sp. 'hensonii']|uniref:hypothetical protein n=1 Tax=Leptolyngbya sp. 'hensonii' TaxID=1922337 RepID=UPI001C0D65F7